MKARKRLDLEEEMDKLSDEMGENWEQIKQFKAVEKRLNDLDIQVAKSIHLFQKSIDTQID